jgi:hypothetical protein
MPPYEEEDFELVLGNRQLFFLAVVLFGLFFSIGYTVGYGRGRNSSDGVSAATQEPSASAALAPVSAPPPARSSELNPSADPALPPDTGSAVSAASEDRGGADAGSSATALSEPVVPAVTAPPVTAPPATSRTTELATSSPATAPATERASTGRTVAGVTNTPRVSAPVAPSPAAEPSRASSSEVSAVAVPEIVPGNIYLQVLASREAEPARKALRDIKAKGHPVALDNLDPDWYRILVGPFATREAADAYMRKLKGEGYNSFLRKF